MSVATTTRSSDIHAWHRYICGSRLPIAPGSGFSVCSVILRNLQIPSPVTQITVGSIGLNEHWKMALLFALVVFATAPTLAFSHTQ